MKAYVRKMNFAFENVPRHYYKGSVFKTHVLNGLHLIIPLGERFFMRSVRRFLDQIEGDSTLRGDVEKFCAQEVQHGLAHERFYTILEAHGYEIRSFLALYDRIAYGFLERRAPPLLRLSVTAASEHFTAVFGQHALAGKILAEAHPVMRELFLWHAAEEIEHKSVCFDVLKRVAGSYAIRMAGFVIGTLLLALSWTGAVIMLSRQEPGIGTAALLKDAVSGIRAGLRGRGKFVRELLQYLRPGFHPSDIDNSALAAEFFAKLRA
jgi:predicted metal-dependent hydrolase